MAERRKPAPGLKGRVRGGQAQSEDQSGSLDSHDPGEGSSASGSHEHGNESGADKQVSGTAPSAADIRDLEKFEPSKEAKRKEPSDVDAMGQDKRRQVVGHTYGPSKRRQFMFFVAVAAVLVVIVGGWLTLVALFDKPPTHFSDRAPWSKTPTDPAIAAEQNAKPVSPASPCGEPGGQYPVPPQSPCAPPSKANGFQGNSAGQ